MANKITQIYTLIDEASGPIEDIRSNYESLDATVDKHNAKIKQNTQSEKEANRERTKTVEGLTAEKQGRTIVTKQLGAADRAYKRLIARYDETARVTNRVAAATKVLDRALKLGVIKSQADYNRQLALVTRGIENQTLATSRNAAAQLSLTKIWERAKFILKTFIAAMAIRAIYAFTVGIVNARLAIEKMNATLLASTGSLLASREGLAFVRKTASDLGLVYKDLALQYSSFIASTQNTALEKKAEDVFSGFSKAAVALRLSSAETQGIFRALTQMVSKGTVQAEELRGQLGERLPGALKIAADSLGVTTDRLGKMLETGQVIAEDLLPEMSKRLAEIYGPEALRAADSMLGSINRLKNAWFDFQAQIAGGTVGSLFQWAFDLGAVGLKGAAEGMASFSERVDMLQAKTFGTVRAFEKLDKITMGAAVAEISRSTMAMQDLSRDLAEAKSRFDRWEITDKIAEWSEYRAELVAVAEALAGVTRKTEDLTLAQIKASNALDGLLEGYDPLFKAQQDMDRAISVLNMAMLETNMSFEEQVYVLDLIQQAYSKTANKALGTAKATAAASTARRKALAAERKELKEFEKAWDAINKQDRMQEKSSLNLSTQLKINQAWKDGARNVTDLTNELALLEKVRAAEVTAKKSGLQEGEAGFKRFVASEVAGEQLKQENKHLAQQRAAMDDLAEGTVAYENALEDIYQLHDKGTPSAIAAVKQLNIEYAHLLPVTEQIKLAMSEAFKEIEISANDVFSKVSDIIKDTFAGAEDAIVGFVKTGKFEIRSLVDDILEQILRMALQQAILGPLATGLSSALSGAFGGMGGGSSNPGSGTSSGQLMFAADAPPFRQGGSFKIPGTGATDSQLVAFRAAPGERVTIDPVGSDGNIPPGGSGDVTVNVINNSRGTETRTEERTTGSGQQVLDVYIESTVARSIARNGVVGRAIDSSRGTRQRSVGR